MKYLWCWKDKEIQWATLGRHSGKGGWGRLHEKIPRLVSKLDLTSLVTGTCSTRHFYKNQSLKKIEECTEEFHTLVEAKLVLNRGNLSENVTRTYSLANLYFSLELMEIRLRIQFLLEFFVFYTNWGALSENLAFLPVPIQPHPSLLPPLWFGTRWERSQQKPISSPNDFTDIISQWGRDRTGPKTQVGKSVGDS